MRGSEFVRAVMRIGRERGVAVTFDKRHGKGSHAMLIFGNCKTTVKDRKKEIGPGLLRKMLSDLGLDARDLS